MRARDLSTRLCTTRVGSRRSGNTRAKLSAKPRRRSAIARSITPPFEVRRPPSKAAVTFLVSTAGNEKSRIVSSVMAGVAFAGEGDGVGFATESYAASALYATLANLSGARWRIKAARPQRGDRPGNAARWVRSISELERSPSHDLRRKGYSSAIPFQVRGPELLQSSIELGSAMKARIAEKGFSMFRANEDQNRLDRTDRPSIPSADRYQGRMKERVDETVFKRIC